MLGDGLVPVSIHSLVVVLLQTATPLGILLVKMLVELSVQAQEHFLWDIVQYQIVSAQVG